MFIRQNGNDIEIHAPAKINLFLELMGRREDGFHEIDTVMQEVSMWDQLIVRPSVGDKISLELDSLHPLEEDFIPTGEKNLVVRACESVRQFALREKLVPALNGLNIKLSKRIPSAAGLGGASSDCAAALVGANIAWKLRLSNDQLVTLAAELGSDVPFFLYGGAARCQGRGEKITPIDSHAGLDLVIVKPQVALPTKDVFAQVEPEENRADASRMLSAIRTGNQAGIAAASFNRLGTAAKKLTDQIGQLETTFESTGCMGHQMSGSGSSYFGVFANQKSARRVCQKLSAQLSNCRVFAVRTLSSSRDRNKHACQTGICLA